MTITLSDIPAAVESYLADHVVITLSEAKYGTYTMTASNAGAPCGLALRNVAYHIESTRPDKVLLQVPHSATVRCQEQLRSSAPLLLPGSYVERMYVTCGDGRLGIGEAQEFDVAIGLARTRWVSDQDTRRSTITVHLHAEIDEDALFAGRRGPTVGRVVKVA